ncbi:uncharacterized protein [Macrobrachium rosenbergii]|uniref:uncharacterized protein n=1 Tax=Macrobrachium rosenbergii TaxID=79674 RepID=UPI0034D73DE8
MKDRNETPSPDSKRITTLHFHNWSFTLRREDDLQNVLPLLLELCLGGETPSTGVALQIEGCCYTPGWVWRLRRQDLQEKNVLGVLSSYIHGLLDQLYRAVGGGTLEKALPRGQPNLRDVLMDY